MQAACAEFQLSNFQPSSLSLSVGNQCKRETKVSFGCLCTTRNHEECDCTGTAYQAGADSWPIVMIVLGATGEGMRSAIGQLAAD